MKLKILITTSSVMNTWEACTALSSKLLSEGQSVGVLGPTDLRLPAHPELQVFQSLSQAKDFEPNMVLPLDVHAASALFNYWDNCKAHSLYKDKLGLALNQLRSFGLSILASAGVPTVNHMVLSNSNDLLRFEAKKQTEPGEWELFPDHPLGVSPSDQGNLAIQKHSGKALSLCFLVSDSKAVKDEAEDAPAYLPPFAYMPVKGLLRRGGLQDYRGLVGKFVASPAAMALSRKVKAACQSVGVKGLVFLDQLYTGREGVASRLHSSSPPGFLSLFLHSGVLGGAVHEMLLSLLKDRRFQLKFFPELHWSLSVTNPLYQMDSAPIQEGEVPGFVAAPPLPLPNYELGYLTGVDGTDVPESLWEVCPTAEVKLDLEASRAEFVALLAELGLEEVATHGSNSKGE